jgi:hypothetical protein
MSSESMKLPLRILHFAFGWCNHSHMSRVFTIKNRTYKVCFECGREFEYSWALMRTLQPNAVDDACAPLSAAILNSDVPVI